MARPQFQLTGHVCHVDSSTTGPVAHSGVYHVLRWVALSLLVSTIVLVVVFIRFTASVIGHSMGQKTRRQHGGVLAHYLSDTLARLAAQRISGAGQTQITHARLRDSAGQIYPVRFEGDFSSGAIAYGDWVTVRFRLVNGVNVVTDGDNHTMRQPIRLQK